MATRQIPQSEWKTYFDQFSRDNQGKAATLREDGVDVGAQEQVAQRQFVGISSDEKGSGAGSIIVILGEETDDNYERMVSSPTTVSVREGEGPVAIQIEQADGPTLIVDFTMTEAGTTSA